MSHTTSTPLNGEPLITLTQAAGRYPGHRGADRLHPATLTRWILRGVRALDGRRVRLEAVRIGCRWLTSEAALARYAAALAATGDPTPPRSPAARNRAAEAAGRELEQLGA
jgi:Protein of unknown function (DUF1580)